MRLLQAILVKDPWTLQKSTRFITLLQATNHILDEAGLVINQPGNQDNGGEAGFVDMDPWMSVNQQSDRYMKVRRSQS